ncbi:CBS domain-containing protein [Actinomycetospora sp. CA-101289]|uniref:CBS domain-containing protein n=1 Tax=Actinomycetospora sp. CA-101289 TaxID=3239893 RepID=UPI003D99A7CA
MRCGGDGVAPGTVVADAMLARPKVCAADLTVARAHELFGDDHVHSLLVVGAGVLLAVVEQADLAGAPAGAAARHHGRLGDRVVGPHEDMLVTWTAMLADGRRRLAVVDEQGVLLGLLCLKRSGRGFCSQADVDARAFEREALAP